MLATACLHCERHKIAIDMKTCGVAATLPFRPVQYTAGSELYHVHCSPGEIRGAACAPLFGLQDNSEGIADLFRRGCQPVPAQLNQKKLNCCWPLTVSCQACHPFLQAAAKHMLCL